MAGFLSDAQVGRYGRLVGDPSAIELERFFRLNGQALRLVAAKRRDHNRLGFAVQWGTVRMLGRFLPEPTEVPGAVVTFVAEQLGIADCLCIGAYAERLPTQHEHARELRRECGYREFAAGEPELRAFVAARAWACEDGPRALFDRSVLWLVEHQVLLPGITVLVRLVAEVRAGEHERLCGLLAAAPPAGVREELEGLLVVREGLRRSPLDRLRTGPTNVSGRGLAGALERLVEVRRIGAGRVELPDVPPVKVAALARYGLSVNAPAVRELSEQRRAATLLVTVRQLETDAVDDALDLFDLLMATKLLASTRARGRRRPRLGGQGAAGSAFAL